jgi:hypothetical protein
MATHLKVSIILINNAIVKCHNDKFVGANMYEPDLPGCMKVCSKSQTSIQSSVLMYCLYFVNNILIDIC